MNIGDYAFGGIVAYIYSDTGATQQGFVVSEEDIGESFWGTTGFTNSSGLTIGTGNGNTTNIINNCPYDMCAASLCVNYSGGGYTDWFLPCNDEAMYLVKLNWLGFGNFLTGDTFYHTSTEIDCNRYGNCYNVDYLEYKLNLSQNINFDVSTWLPEDEFPEWRCWGATSKNNILKVRAIRYF